jgi:hypothetical protein
MIAKSGEPAARSDWIPSRAQQLKIDAFLVKLPAKMRSSKVSNVHIEARRWIILAVEKACCDLERRQIAERGLGAALETFGGEAAKLAGNIADLLNAADHPQVSVRGALAPDFGHRPARMDGLHRNDVAMAIHAAFDTIANAYDAALTLAEFASAAKNHLSPGHTSGDVWRQGFVSQLCVGWRDMTGCDPTPDGDRFRGFVESCYASLAGDAGANGLPHFRGWTGVIRTIVKNRPDWNGLLRNERSLDPPPGTRGFDEDRARLATKWTAQLTALAQVPGARELFERFAGGHLDGKPRKSRPK